MGSPCLPYGCKSWQIWGSENGMQIGVAMFDFETTLRLNLWSDACAPWPTLPSPVRHAPHHLSTSRPSGRGARTWPADPVRRTVCPHRRLGPACRPNAACRRSASPAAAPLLPAKARLVPWFCVWLVSVWVRVGSNPPQREPMRAHAASQDVRSMERFLSAETERGGGTERNATPRAKNDSQN